MKPTKPTTTTTTTKLALKLKTPFASGFVFANGAARCLRLVKCVLPSAAERRLWLIAARCSNTVAVGAAKLAVGKLASASSRLRKELSGAVAALFPHASASHAAKRVWPAAARETRQLPASVFAPARTTFFVCVSASACGHLFVCLFVCVLCRRLRHTNATLGTLCTKHSKDAIRQKSNVVAASGGGGGSLPRPLPAACQRGAKVVRRQNNFALLALQIIEN